MQIPVRIRLYIAGELVDEEEVRGDERAHDIAFQCLLHKHADIIVREPHMIEVEFLDETDIRQRFLRFGTDPEGMTKPLPIGLAFRN